MKMQIDIEQLKKDLTLISELEFRLIRSLAGSGPVVVNNTKAAYFGWMKKQAARGATVTSANVIVHTMVHALAEGRRAWPTWTLRRAV